MLAELLRRAQAVPVDADFFGGCAGKQQQQQQRRRRRQRQRSAARTASGLGRLVRLLLKRLLECRALIEKRQRQLQRWTARQSASGDGKRRIVKRTISVHGKYRTGKNDAQLLHFPVLVAGPPFTNPALSAPRRRFFVATAVVYDIRQVVRFCVLTTSRRGAAAEKTRVTVESTGP